MRTRAKLTLVTAAIAVVAIAFWIRSAAVHGESEGQDARAADPRSAPTASTDLQDPRTALERVEPPTQEGDAPSSAKPATDPPPEAPSEIRGRVVDATTGLPIESFEVLCAPDGAEQTLVETVLGMENATDSASSSFANAGGRFAIAVPNTDTHTLCAFARGYARSESVYAMLGDDLEIRLEPAAIVRGRVVDPSTGNPVAGALVGWVDRPGQRRTGPLDRFWRTDALGRFELESVPLSARAVIAGRLDLGVGLSERFDLAPEKSEREVVIELR